MALAFGCLSSLFIVGSLAQPFTLSTTQQRTSSPGAVWFSVSGLEASVLPRRARGVAVVEDGA
eukprot:1063344-Lingulodinium_polyedra.AAC.1